MQAAARGRTPAPRPITIAHRGASGYLPEHSLPAKALAHGMGAEFLEQDVVATRDNYCVVLHDIHLDRVTDVTSAFPGRGREDGRYFARDFTLAELKSLTLTERVGEDGAPVFPGRYPGGPTPLAIPTLAEELEFIAGLNRSTAQRAGVYPEIKKPAWHRAEGVDLSALVLETLARGAWDAKLDQVWLQCFDLKENIRLHNELKAPYKLVQLIADDAWGESSTVYADLLAPGGLTQLKGIVAGIGPWLPQLYELAPNGTVMATPLIEEAHALGLQVHPYTLRADALPEGFASLQAVAAWLVSLDCDGIFTDFPDQTVAAFDALGLAPARS
ncbi:MAG: glycerophosphodiester phosphodiesterase [Pseudomonadota bacterium]